MKPASLLEFARTGAFAGITIGHSRRQVESILGLPETWGMPPSPIESAEIWKYGDIEFYFHDDELWMIFTDTFEILTGGPSMNLNPWIIRYGMHQHDFEAALRKEQITFTCAHNRHNEGEIDLTTDAKVCFTFRESANEYGPAGLCAMQTQNTNDG